MLQPRSTAARLFLNGVLLILAGYLCGAAIPHVPYPRIIAMHAIPALALMAAWAILAWGMRQGERTPVTAGVDNLSMTKGEVPS